MIKQVIFTFTATSLLFSANVNFQMAPTQEKRVHPSSSSEILSYNTTIEKSISSVVNISTKQSVKVRGGLSPMMDDPFFREFFERFYGQQHGGLQPQEQVQRALGSGVIVSKDGYIVTNSHVVRDSDEITVTLPDSNKEYKAMLIGNDQDSDLAVIKIDAKDIQPMMLGDSDNLKLGDVVFAIGNPFGVGQSVTSGIISALNKNRVGINKYENFIQTDASINPGNSGGALVDSRGALIGINSAILTKSGGNNGIGFAIPVNMMKNIATKLITDGKVIRGYLGVSINDITKDLRALYNRDYGAIVLDVEYDSPASKYGIQRGDLIIEVDDKKIKDASTLQTVIASLKPDEKVKMVIERNKRDINLNIVLSQRDGGMEAKIKNTNMEGLELNNLTPQNRREYRIGTNTTGVLIENVKPNSKAESIGLQAGDVIVQIEDKVIEDINALQNVMAQYKNDPKRIFVNRYGNILIFVMK